jgi:tetratricopeptide (TPR) repeat protein
MLRLIVATGFVTVWLSSAQGKIEPTAADRARATALFREGRALMATGRNGEACPKLAESQRLDPSGGTLLNLALCDERAGQLARARREFDEAAAVARREGRADREAEATTRARAIAARIAAAGTPAAAALLSAPSARRPAWLAALAIGVAAVVAVCLLRARLGGKRGV